MIDTLEVLLARMADLPPSLADLAMAERLVIAATAYRDACLREALASQVFDDWPDTR